MSFQQTATAPAHLAGAVPVAKESVPVRLAFLRKVYALFGGALLVWTGITALTITNESFMNFAFGLFGYGFLGWTLVMLGMFALLRFTATKFPLNLVALAAFAVLQGLITGPIIVMTTGTVTPQGIALGANTVSAVSQAFLLTATIFGSLSAYVFITKKDFNFMRGVLWTGFGLAIGVIALGFFFEGLAAFSWSTGFAAAMVLLMSGFVLYDTSKILREYPANMATSAAAVLFVDFVMLFRYLLILLSNRD